jgi:hypothetical protein
MPTKQWQTFKIIGRKHYRHNPDFIYFDLDGYFCFANRISEQIWCANQQPFKDWKVGDTIKLDLNWLMRHDPSQNDCTIKSTEVAQLANNSFNLPPISAVISGSYRQWENEEFQARIQGQQQQNNFNQWRSPSSK